MISYFRNIMDGSFRIEGLSTDTKPTADIPNAATFVEIDTGDQFKFDASTSSWGAFVPIVKVATEEAADANADADSEG